MEFFETKTKVLRKTHITLWFFYLAVCILISWKTRLFLWSLSCLEEVFFFFFWLNVLKNLYY